MILVNVTVILIYKLPLRCYLQVTILEHIFLHYDYFTIWHFGNLDSGLGARAFSDFFFTFHYSMPKQGVWGTRSTNLIQKLSEKIGSLISDQLVESDW